MWSAHGKVREIVKDHLERHDGMFPFYREAIAKLQGNYAEAKESVAQHFRVQYGLWQSHPESAIAVSHEAFRELHRRLV